MQFCNLRISCRSTKFFIYLCAAMLEIFLIALALAMDCFAVSVVCGVLTRKADVPLLLRLAFLFGFFQGLMPLLGWLLTSRFSSQLEAWDHWIAFGMLSLIGGKMIADSFGKEDESSIHPRNLRTQLALAIATSIDALAVGISFACTGYTKLSQLWLPVGVIGLVSFALSIAGFLLGERFGEVVNRKVRPELVGGIILICIGLKILLTHLGII